MAETAFIDSLIDGALLVDEDGRVIACNAAAKAVFGTDVSGEPLSAVLQSATLEAGRATLRAEAPSITADAWAPLIEQWCTVRLSKTKTGEMVLFSKRSASAATLPYSSPTPPPQARWVRLLANVFEKVTAGKRIDDVLDAVAEFCEAAIPSLHWSTLSQNTTGQHAAAVNALIAALERRHHHDGGLPRRTLEHPPSASEVEFLNMVGLLSSVVLEKWKQSQQLRDALERFQLVLTSTQRVVYEWSLPNNRLTWNARMQDAFGHVPDTSTGALDWWLEQVHVDDRERVERELRKAISEPGIWTSEYRFKCANGRYLWVYDLAVIMEDSDGKPSRMVGVMQDVTDERELRARVTMSERLASVGTLAGGVAHEINNPLAWISSNVTFVLEELDRAVVDVDVIDALNEIRAGAERVETIVRNLKTFSQVNDDVTEPIDVRRPLESALTMTANQLRDRARLVREEHHTPQVEASEARLCQVFLNLLLNACQAIPKGQAAQHEIRVVTRTDSKGNAVVEFRDTGTGIAPAAISRVFDPFFTTKPINSGASGLGLSVCHTLITSIGGRLDVSSDLGRGTTFIVTLPPAIEQPLAPPPSAPPTVSRRGRIVVVDSEPAIIATIQRVLGERHEVVGYTNIDHALGDLSIHGADVILCDLLLPSGGPDFWSRVKQQWPQLTDRIVFMIGGAYTNHIRQFIDSARPIVLEKPFTTDSLRTVVNARVDRFSTPPPMSPPAL